MKNLGISHNQIFTGSLPIAKGEFPLHVKDAVKANPLLESSFMDLHAHSRQRPIKSSVVKSPSPIAPKLGPPIKSLSGLKKK